MRAHTPRVGSIVVGYKVFNSVFREELSEFSVKLCRERLVMRHHDRGSLQLLNHVSHGEGFTAPGNTQECLRREPCADSVHQLLYRARLITGGLV